MIYQLQLQQPQWIKKRLEILERDDFKCTRCGIEKPLLKGLVSSFGILSLEQLKEDKGYSIVPLSDELTYNQIYLMRGNKINSATYIGDTSIPFNIEKLKFSLKAVDPYAYPANNKVEHVCFYEDVLNGRNLVDLNVHHRYYISGHLAWEYENTALTSLCVDCHQYIHSNEDIVVYDKQKRKLYTTNPCFKCRGSGYLVEYNYYMKGVCFKCGGEGAIIE